MQLLQLGLTRKAFSAAGSMGLDPFLPAALGTKKVKAADFAHPLPRNCLPAMNNSSDISFELEWYFILHITCHYTVVPGCGRNVSLGKSP